MAKLRHQTFFSLAELNQCIRILLIELNQKPFKQMPGSRQQWFEKLDQPALSPLPKYAYQYTDIKTPRVNIDYHLIYDQHLYSVPHHCVGNGVRNNLKGSKDCRNRNYKGAAQGTNSQI